MEVYHIFWRLIKYPATVYIRLIKFVVYRPLYSCIPLYRRLDTFWNIFELIVYIRIIKKVQPALKCLKKRFLLDRKFSDKIDAQKVIIRNFLLSIAGGYI